MAGVRHVFALMLKATAFPSAVKTFQVFWLVSGFCLAAGSTVDLQITSQNRAASCGQNVTLTCSATSTNEKDDIKLFSWMYKNNDLCNQTEPKVQCSRAGTNLTLELFNVMPVDARIYICKIRAVQGAKSAPINITVEECTASSDISSTRTAAHCSFSGFYPSGVVHWFYNNTDVTDKASTEEPKMDQEGRFSVSSTMKVEKGKQKQTFNCSLWIPSLEKYASSRQVVVDASGCLVTLQWICMVVEIIMLAFVM